MSVFLSQIKLLPGSTEPEEVSFVPRVASWVKFTVLSQYSEGGIRFTEIEVYNGACVDGACFVFKNRFCFCGII